MSVSNINTLDEKLLARTVSVSTVYFNNTNMVEISYLDKSNKTSFVTLEVEGLAKSFQKNYTTSSFVEDLPLSSPPQYGWQTLPVTFTIEHKDFGKIFIKTIISPSGEQQASVIYGRP